MKNDIYAIRVQNLEKIFKVYSSPKQMLKEFLLGGTRHKEFHALKKISFEVKRGEAVGVMGRNGSGKSTLLRILAGTLNATRGLVEIRGRVSAILELGTGFNPEYTGRENIVSGCLVLGMRRAEINAKMDEIIAFSELENFIDQPFRTYSSGMQARLTFATAISVSPDVLIVDEALAVGDARFQAKCYRHMQSFRECGGTIFFVSHADNAIAQLCDTALLLEKGEVLSSGTPRAVGQKYLALLYDQQPKLKQSTAIKLESKLMSQRIGSREYAEILSFAVYDVQGNVPQMFESGKSYSLHMRINVKKEMNKWSFGCCIKDVRGVRLFSVDTRGTEWKGAPLTAGSEYVCITNIKLWLTNGTYYIGGGIACLEADNQVQDYYDDAIVMVVALNQRLHNYSVVDLSHEFEIVKQ